MNHPVRVVLDTNVVLSALLFTQGRLAPLRAAWQKRLFHPLLSTATGSELLRALAYPKFKLTAQEQEELLSDYLPYCTVVRVPARLPTRLPPCRDANDVPFLQLAVAGKAACLVSGDRDLLSLAGQFGRPIIRPDEFLLKLSDVMPA